METNINKEKDFPGIYGEGKWKILRHPDGGKTAMWVEQCHLDAFERFIVEKYNDYKYGLGHNYRSWYLFLESSYRVGKMWVLFNPNKIEHATLLF